MNEDLLSLYKEQVAIARSIDYANKSSVRKNNKAVDKMYAIVEAANRVGMEEVLKLSELLNNAEASIWIAHQLIEKVDNLPANVVKKCFKIVEAVATAKSLNAIGEQMWLKEWKQKFA